MDSVPSVVNSEEALPQSAQPQPKLASAAKADFIKASLRPGEARPSEGSRKSAHGATNLTASSTEEASTCWHIPE